MRAYAIGDVHGYLGELERVHRLIAEDRAKAGYRDAPVVHIGDLCDRGPNTKGVLDFLLAGQARGEPWHIVRGNHDRMMQLFLEDDPREDTHLIVGMSWLHPNLGGETTLASYGIEIGEGERMMSLHPRARAAVPAAHRDFLDALPNWIELDGLLFVHAGLRPGVPLADQDEDDLFWIRAPFLESSADHGWLVVHGHTPVETVEHHGNRVNIDTGAGYGKPISAVVIEGREVWLLTEAGRVQVSSGARR